ncbi:MAG TPA: SDR family oxidoreductase [Gammaproteobacteria bacterium]|nr:SDR family oxidoreductase [Gammaproteobacteria bacterium]
MNFHGRQVLVTGASSGGLGYGMARAFLEAGAAVAITGTKPQQTYAVDFEHMSFHRMNAEDPDSIDALAARFDRLDVLINCIGHMLPHKQEFERSGFEKIVTINLTAVMHLCTAFFPLLEAARGCIVNIDSVSAIRPMLNNPAYTASKAGLRHLNAALAQKWGPRGVRINGISPGVVPTGLTTHITTPAHVERMKKTNPIPRFGTVEDIAGGALFLASPLASYITGQSIVIDGGMSL